MNVYFFIYFWKRVGQGQSTPNIRWVGKPTGGCRLRLRADLRKTHMPHTPDACGLLSSHTCFKSWGQKYRHSCELFCCCLLAFNEKSWLCKKRVFRLMTDYLTTNRTGAKISQVLKSPSWRARRHYKAWGLLHAWFSSATALCHTPYPRHWWVTSEALCLL